MCANLMGETTEPAAGVVDACLLEETAFEVILSLLSKLRGISCGKGGHTPTHLPEFIITGSFAQSTSAQDHSLVFARRSGHCPCPQFRQFALANPPGHGAYERVNRYGAKAASQKAASIGRHRPRRQKRRTRRLSNSARIIAKRVSRIGCEPASSERVRRRPAPSSTKTHSASSARGEGLDHRAQKRR
jgi:hypothetical protein